MAFRKTMKTCSHVMLTLVCSSNFFIYYFKHGNVCQRGRRRRNASVPTTGGATTRMTTTTTTTGVSGVGAGGVGAVSVALDDDAAEAELVPLREEEEGSPRSFSRSPCGDGDQGARRMRNNNKRRTMTVRSSGGSGNRRLVSFPLSLSHTHTQRYDIGTRFVY